MPFANEGFAESIILDAFDCDRGYKGKITSPVPLCKIDPVEKLSGVRSK